MLFEQESIELVYLTFPSTSLTVSNGLDARKNGGKKRQCSGNKFSSLAANNILIIRYLLLVRQ